MNNNSELWLFTNPEDRYNYVLNEGGIPTIIDIKIFHGSIETIDRDVIKYENKNVKSFLMFYVYR